MQVKDNAFLNYFKAYFGHMLKHNGTLQRESGYA